MAASLHQRVVDEVGRPIVDGTTVPGTVMLADEIERHLGVSRSVVREAVRVLQSMGLVASIKHIGIRVQPSNRWNFYHPQVIRWRLEGVGRGGQLRAIVEVGSALEPMAAELAARYGSPEMADELVRIAEQMRSLNETADPAEYLELDTRYHRLVLHASGNEMFAMLDEAIAIVLLDPAALSLVPKLQGTDEVVNWHLQAARAIRGRNPVTARRSMEHIIRRAFAELEEVWGDAPRQFFP
ncbi:FadR/GntR family transcriptional regulator [Salinibacterium sp. ZJ450]|uniref:FadR/GntR family transcriptional regulator n=1 Tax=Salinibacterium sp. ZJ450 TaxID=2708338 RepID=UPI0014206334|nr:FCD domain-containing protein [Salinibacterium sp. ZJ450]